jgi:hypothetical protein
MFARWTGRAPLRVPTGTFPGLVTGREFPPRPSIFLYDSRATGNIRGLQRYFVA